MYGVFWLACFLYEKSKMSLSQFLYQNRIFLAISGTYVLLASAIIYLTKQGDAVLWFDAHHTFVSDLFFKMTTYIGDGIFIVLFLIGLAFRNYRHVIFIGISLGINALVVQQVKHYLNFPRPRKYFWPREDFHFILPPDDVHGDFSFPSGHSNGAFTLLFCLVIISYKSKKTQIILGLLAISASISRLVLFQHFLRDTVVGASIAIVLTTVLYFIFKQIPFFKKELE